MIGIIQRQYGIVVKGVGLGSVRPNLNPHSCHGYSLSDFGPFTLSYLNLLTEEL